MAQIPSAILLHPSSIRGSIILLIVHNDIPGTVMQESKVQISTRHDPESDFISVMKLVTPIPDGD